MSPNKASVVQVEERVCSCLLLVKKEASEQRLIILQKQRQALEGHGTLSDIVLDKHSRRSLRREMKKYFSILKDAFALETRERFIGRLIFAFEFWDMGRGNLFCQKGKHLAVNPTVLAHFLKLSPFLSTFKAAGHREFNAQGDFHFSLFYREWIPL